MRQKRHCGATIRRGTPCQCKAIETKRGAWHCKLHGGKSTGPTSAEVERGLWRQLVHVTPEPEATPG